MRPHHGWIIVATALVALSLVAVADNAGEAPATQPAETTPSAQEVIDQLIDQRQDVAPDQGAPPRTAAATTPIDPAVIGTAPGGKLPTLRREGDIVVARRGRLVQSPDGASSLFAFEADDRQSPETPMILLPCQMLENMENMQTQTDEQMVFVASGQITTYRGANYLLLTMMKPALNIANLR